MSNYISLTPAPKIEILKGKAVDPIFTFKDGDGNVVDISLAEITLTVKETPYDTSATFTRKNTAAGGSDTEIEFVTDGTDGQIRVHFTQANTQDLEEDEYVYDFKVVLNSKPRGVKYGIMQITESLNI